MQSQRVNSHILCSELYKQRKRKSFSFPPFIFTVIFEGMWVVNMFTVYALSFRNMACTCMHRSIRLPPHSSVWNNFTVTVVQQKYCCIIKGNIYSICKSSFNMYSIASGDYQLSRGILLRKFLRTQANISSHFVCKSLCAFPAASFEMVRSFSRVLGKQRIGNTDPANDLSSLYGNLLVLGIICVLAVL